METHVPQSDPRLVELSNKIENLCQQYEVMAFYGLSGKTHTEFKTVFPNWSCIQQEGPRGFRLRAQHTEMERATTSIGSVFSLREVAGLMVQNFSAVAEVINEHFKVDHKSFPGLKDLSNWQSPDLPATPFEVIDLSKTRASRSKPKGFDKKPEPVGEAVSTLLQIALEAGKGYTIDIPDIHGTGKRGIVVSFCGEDSQSDALVAFVKQLAHKGDV